MSKHTPGPWQIERYKEPYDNTFWSYQVRSDNGLVVAKCGTGDFEIPHNAHLIAAAPKMLGALEYLRTRLDDIEDIRLAVEVIIQAEGDYR